MIHPVPLLRALAFASERHSRQRRKDADASPYINHPIAVARLLAEDGGVVDETLLIAAVLHDTIEDTETTAEELRERFARGARAHRVGVQRAAAHAARISGRACGERCGGCLAGGAGDGRPRA